MRAFKEPRSYIQRVLTRPISRMNPLNWVEEEPPVPPVPVLELNPLQTDDQLPYDQVLFNTSLTPNYSDFNNWESVEGMLVSELCGFSVTQDGGSSSGSSGIMAIDMSETLGTPNSWGLADPEGLKPYWCSNQAFADFVASILSQQGVTETVSVGWNASNLKEALIKYGEGFYHEEYDYTCTVLDVAEGIENVNGHLFGYRAE